MADSKKSQNFLFGKNTFIYGQLRHRDIEWFTRGPIGTMAKPRLKPLGWSLSVTWTSSWAPSMQGTWCPASQQNAGGTTGDSTIIFRN